MPSIYDLKPRFQALLRPVANRMAGAGVTANHVTLAAMILSFAVGGLIYWMPTHRWPLFLVPAFLFIRMALNAIDGILAREHGMRSDVGAVLNELGDVFSDAALYLPLACIPGVRAEAVIIAVVLAVITEMTGVVGVQIGASRRYDGPMGKSDRAFVFGALALALGCGAPAGVWLRVVLWVIVALLLLTVINRARRALGELQ
jgi:phosphatidylglycerophosphate synthase